MVWWNYTYFKWSTESLEFDKIRPNKLESKYRIVF
jgi:hypothetical protein